MILFLKAGIPFILPANSFARIPASERAKMASDSLSLAFQRELSFQRGQILIETATDPFVLTSVIQDPTFYFRANFDTVSGG